MSALELQTHLSASVTELHDRVQAAADLSELIRRDQLPQSPVAGFVVPLGLRSRSEGDAGASAFAQMIDELFGVVLIVRTSGDLAGGKSLPSIDTLVWKVILAVCGADDPQAIGVYRLQKGSLIDLKSGAIFYQLDFAIQRQIRVMP
jgi:hypothetical protein